MTETKIRYYITPSSLGSYFGVGFNTPEEQWKIDTGKEGQVFDEDSVLRLELGKHLEDAVIDYFQNVVFKTEITERNEDLKWGYDDKIKYQIDGKLQLDVPTIFENKVSNSKSYRFTDNMGYIIQVHAYMLCENVDKAVLGGLYQGRPIYKVIDKDEELIEDIKEMVDFLYDALNGIVDFYEDYPTHLLDKYGKTKLYEPINNMSRLTIDYYHELAELNRDKKEVEDKIKELKRRYENAPELEEGVYEDDKIILRVTDYTIKGRFDVDSFMVDFPNLDLTKYYTTPTTAKKTVIKIKEPN